MQTQLQFRKLSSRIKTESKPQEKQAGRKVSGRIKIEEKKKESAPEYETICNSNGCNTKIKPALLNESDLQNMSYVDLVKMLDKQSQYHSIHLPNDFSGMVRNFDSHLKTTYNEERIEGIGDLTNMRLITTALKRFIK